MQDYVKLWTALKWYLWRHIEIFQLMQIHLNFSNSQNEHYAINLLKTKFIHHFQLFLLHWERCISYFPLISIFDCLVADSMIFRPCTTNYKLIRPISISLWFQSLIACWHCGTLNDFQTIHYKLQTNLLCDKLFAT